MFLKNNVSIRKIIQIILLKKKKSNTRAEHEV